MRYREIDKMIVGNRLDIAVILSRHCNLNCRYCVTYSNIAKQEFYDFDKIINDLIYINKIRYINDISFTGGEPLLYPRLTELLYKVRELFPDAELTVFSNLKDFYNVKDLVKTLKETNCKLYYSKYPININYENIIQECEKNNIKIKNIALDNGTNIIHNVFVQNTVSKTQKSKYTNGEKVRNICIKCIRLFNSIMYICDGVFNANVVNDKFNENFKLSEKDILRVKDFNYSKLIKMLLSTTDYCKYCMCEEIPHKWNLSKPEKIDFITE